MTNDRPIIVVADGVMEYLSEEDVKALLNESTVSQRFFEIYAKN
jgi:O-methyltransferase involved in polyketide biosynthesis